MTGAMLSFMPVMVRFKNLLTGMDCRRKTAQSQKDPKRLIDKLVHFVLQVRRLRNQHSYRVASDFQ